MKNTGIEWTNNTWNPVRGCLRVSEGCVNCYAEGVANRFGGTGQPYEGLTVLDNKGKPRWNGEIMLVPEKLAEPLQWKKPALVFVNSMSDVFYEKIPRDYIITMFAVMILADWHKYQILTKRAWEMLEFVTSPDFIPDVKAKATELLQLEIVSAFKNPKIRLEMLNKVHDLKMPLKNVWFGVSVENQAAAVERVPALCMIPGITFVSYEPALGEIDLEYIRTENGRSLNAFTGVCMQYSDDPYAPVSKLSWVIAGGESGSGARIMELSWLESIQMQCNVNNTPFFFKQWGEYIPRGWYNHSQALVNPSGVPLNMQYASPGSLVKQGELYYKRVGKTLAGAELWGKEYKEFPGGAKV